MKVPQGEPYWNVAVVQPSQQFIVGPATEGQTYAACLLEADGGDMSCLIQRLNLLLSSRNRQHRPLWHKPVIVTKPTLQCQITIDRTHLLGQCMVDHAALDTVPIHLCQKRNTIP